MSLAATSVRPASSWWHASKNTYRIDPGANDKPHTLAVTTRSAGIAHAVRFAVAFAAAPCESALGR